MADKAWKAVERRIAAFFGAARNALSGRNAKVSASDSVHDKLFIECKHRERHTTWTLWNATKKLAAKEGKTPVLALQEKGRHGALLVVNTEDLDTLILERLVAYPELFWVAQKRIQELEGELLSDA